MAFTSQLYPNEIIIDDATGTDVTHDSKFGRGLIEAVGYRGTPAEPFPAELLIPRSEWEARIKEQEERKTRLSDLVNLAGLPCKNQESTSFCWINAPTHCTEIVRVKQNQPMVILSPASAGAQITNYRNVGGWGREGLEWIVNYGVCPVANWPANALDRKYATPENKEIAKFYQVTEWWDLEPGNLDQQISCLLLGLPIAVGQNYWSHEITQYEAIWLNGTVAIRGRNSWGMSWGDKGYFIQQGSKMRADDAVTPRVTIAA